MKICCLVLLIKISLGLSNKYPNDIEGSPTIECGRETISIQVNTSNSVASRIFAKNQHENDKCSFKSVNSATFVLSDCGMNRQRQLEPRGLSFNLVVVVQLHPLFITKVDRAYNLKCFYTEAAKTVTASLEVSMLQTDSISSGGEAATSAVTAATMPQCNYTLHMDSPSGPLAKYAKIGDKVWHLWECSSEVFGILIHSCYVTDGQGNDFKILDEIGCGIDQYVLKTPEYSVTLNKAQQETHVFKFADKMVVLFNCQIKLCHKANEGCKGITPPDCSNVTGVTGERLESIIRNGSNNNSDEISKPENPHNESKNFSETVEESETKGANVTQKLRNQNASESVDQEISSLNTTKTSKENETSTELETLPLSKEGNKNKTEGGEENIGPSSNSSKNFPENKTEENLLINSTDTKNATSAEKTGKAVESKEGKESSKISPGSEEKFRLQMFFARNQTVDDARERRNIDRDDRGEKLRRIMLDSVDLDDLETDVAQRIWVLEPEESSPIDHHGIDSSLFNKNEDDDSDSPNGQVCVSNSRFALIIGCLVFCLILSLVFVVCLCILIKRKRTVTRLTYHPTPDVKSFALYKN